MNWAEFVISYPMHAFVSPVDSEGADEGGHGGAVSSDPSLVCCAATRNFVAGEERASVVRVRAAVLPHS